MTPKEAKDKYGATHYLTMKDGITPQMYYKTETMVNRGVVVVYLSFAKLWMGSSIEFNSPEFSKLKVIGE